MQAEYIKAGFTEIHRAKVSPGQIDDTELVIEDAENDDLPAGVEPDEVAIVVKHRPTGDDLCTVQLTQYGASQLVRALNARLGIAEL